jgi:hypothetical protein
LCHDYLTRLNKNRTGDCLKLKYKFWCFLFVRCYCFFVLFFDFFFFFFFCLTHFVLRTSACSFAEFYSVDRARAYIFTLANSFIDFF